ncbi:AfsR/SARP family transcriptional regulator [Actinomycetospora sp. CA-053990]|uniref:AfsR/SARP family transcriptional regulator n=1 Tax=Actinomycetospora sp. CA-053990 TaxID=3239891 RepID=UPI003D8E5A1B
MRRGDRLLELPAAACFLAEAQARGTGVRARADADASAALALQVAEAHGSTALLLAALAEVPAVAVRGAAAGTPESLRWQALATRAGAGADETGPAEGARVVLEEFGVPELLVDGRPVALRRRKELELLAHLLDRPGRAVRREELLDALFSGRGYPGAASYLRQCLHRLRAALPEGVDLDRDGERLRLVPPDAVAGTCGQVLAALRHTGARGREERRALLADALRRADRGVFLDGTPGAWADTRRREVADRVAAGRLELATLAADDGDLEEAERQVARVLADDPYREQAWRIRLVVDGAGGDHDRLVEHYRSYVAVMRELDMGPSAEMHRLVETIRGVTGQAGPTGVPAAPARPSR